MSAIFPQWTNRLPLYLIVGGALAAGGVTAGCWYYLTPKYARVGYQPVQPALFSHAVHVRQLGMDCRHCHDGVEKSWFANVPTAETCMKCHNQVMKNDPQLAVVRESFATGQPVPWVWIHKAPDFAFFNHSVHVNRGVSCVECHGQVDEMTETYHAQPLSMSFCLDCHRNPAPRLRPLDKITDLRWQRSDASQTNSAATPSGGQIARDWNVQPRQTCGECHR